MNGSRQDPVQVGCSQSSGGEVRGEVARFPLAKPAFLWTLVLQSSVEAQPGLSEPVKHTSVSAMQEVQAGALGFLDRRDLQVPLRAMQCVGSDHVSGQDGN